MGTKYPVAEAFVIPTASYTGKIIKTDKRTLTFGDETGEYTDIFVEVDFTMPNSTSKPVLKISYPSYISKNSRFGQFLSQFVSLDGLKELDVDEILIGKKLKFDIVQEKSKKAGDKRTFSNISQTSVVVI